MALFKYGEKLYSGLVETMTAHLKEISKTIQSAEEELFLEELNRRWAEHKKASVIIRNILMFMDRTFACTYKTPVYDLCLNLWRDNVIHFSYIRARLLNTLLNLILKERTGEVINRGLMSNVIKMLMDLGASVYEEDFEKLFLEVSANFYRVESQRLIQCCNCGDYLQEAKKRLNEEIERVSI